MEELKVTCIQANLKWENRKENLALFDKFFFELKETSDLIILPEMFTSGFSMNSGALAENMDGYTVEWMRSRAKKLNAAIVGSLIIADDGEFYNRLIWMNPEGTHHFYDKKYLFSLAKENENYSAGRERIIVEYKGWKICPLICYDLRFPEWSRNTEFFDLLIYVANWPIPRSSHWSALLRARAIENQCYVIGVNRVGSDAAGNDYSGNSSIYNYDGVQIAEEVHKEAVISFKLIKTPLLQYREKLPFLEDQESLKPNNNVLH